MRRSAFLTLFFMFPIAATPAPDNRMHLLPEPQSVRANACARPFTFTRPLRVPLDFDPAAVESLDARWSALGLPGVVRSSHPDVTVHRARLASQAYRLRVGSNGAVRIDTGSNDGAFYAAMTLAQLPQRTGAGWTLPCAEIDDAPALKWRVLSDDVSRGPLPTMRYFKERIRTIAAFKMNGYSPYMEQVFVAPEDPLPAPFDGITPAQLRALDTYAKRYHVTLIPEQQTFAHMHGTLALERYAGAAELQHDFLLSPASPISNAYLARVIRAELAAVPHPPFFHVGSDETSELGDGASKELVAQRGRAAVYAAHIRAMNDIIAPSGARVMLWDDGIQNDPSIMPLLPKNAVVVNWHYGDEKTFEPYIARIASGGFQQMVAPGANNWNELYPDIATAMRNERTFVNEGKAAHVLGLFQTVWHDDGETLYEATWYPVLYAASSAWETRNVDPERYRSDFPFAFFGSNDSGYARDIADLTDAQSRATANPYDTSNYLFWADALDPRIAARMSDANVHAMRLDAEDVETHLLQNAPPLHANAARVMYLAARRYDLLGRKFQIAREVRGYYADAAAQAGKPHSRTVRDLYWCKYWFWELRDTYEALAPLYKSAWLYESRPGHLASNLERYHLAAQRAIIRADDVNTMTYEDYVRAKHFPSLEQTLGLPAIAPLPAR
ncbi:MAG: beta-N-acetylhexosaminidase [Candidatus Eremiobacteraeota bacterium]|nr:beta-N-acetylhexosaminidase [Candidatus Eremiobacteraeota bacterium]